MVILMIMALDPFGAAFGRLAVEGSTPEIEGIISGYELLRVGYLGNLRDDRAGRVYRDDEIDLTNAH